jgi:hypothetical protein
VERGQPKFDEKVDTKNEHGVQGLKVEVVSNNFMLRCPKVTQRQRGRHKNLHVGSSNRFQSGILNTRYFGKSISLFSMKNTLIS